MLKGDHLGLLVDPPPSFKQALLEDEASPPMKYPTPASIGSENQVWDLVPLPAGRKAVG